MLRSRLATVRPVALVVLVSAGTTAVSASSASARHHSIQASPPGPRTTGWRLGLELTQFPVSSVTLLSRRPLEHIEVDGRDQSLSVGGSITFVSLLGSRVTYGAQTGLYLMLGGYELAMGDVPRRLTWTSTTMFETGDEALVLSLALPGAGVRAVGSSVAAGVELAPALTWYGYGGRLTRLADSTSTSVTASATFLSVAIESHLCLGGDANGRFAGYCFFGAPIVALWAPGAPIIWNPGVTFGLRAAIM
jgi:hypothetical protein